MINKKKEKGWIAGLTIALSVIIICLLLFVVQWHFPPSGHTRIILDHTNEVYVAPPCFEQAQLTNNLTETTWSKAYARGYKPESVCSLEKLSPVSDSLWNKMLEITGLRSDPWAW